MDKRQYARVPVLGRCVEGLLFSFSPRYLGQIEKEYTKTGWKFVSGRKPLTELSYVFDSDYSNCSEFACNSCGSISTIVNQDSDFLLYIGASENSDGIVLDTPPTITVTEDVAMEIVGAGFTGVIPMKLPNADPKEYPPGKAPYWLHITGWAVEAYCFMDQQTNTRVDICPFCNMPLVCPKCTRDHFGCEQWQSRIRDESKFDVVLGTKWSGTDFSRFGFLSGQTFVTKRVIDSFSSKHLGPFMYREAFINTDGMPLTQRNTLSNLSEDFLRGN